MLSSISYFFPLIPKLFAFFFDGFQKTRHTLPIASLAATLRQSKNNHLLKRHKEVSLATHSTIPFKVTCI